MPTDDERREVAARLRGITVDDLVSYMDDGIDSASILFSEVRGKNEVRPFLEEARYLADLIEPSCDRDALLALADEMEGIYRAPDAARWYARRIREACGEGEA